MYNHQPPFNPSYSMSVPSQLGFRQTEPPKVYNVNKELKIIGEGSVTASPDTVTITMGVITESTSLQDAQQENSQRVTSVIQGLTSLNIPQRNIQTSDFRIDMLYDYIEGKQVFRTYQVTHLLTITLSNLDMAGLVVDTGVENGVNIVRGIEFSIANPSMAYDRAIVKALQDGQRKAQTIGQSLQITVTPTPTKIEEITDRNEVGPLLFAKAETVTPIQPGTLQIKAIMELIFNYS